MPVYQELINFDEAFHQLTVPPIIINDLVTYTETDRNNIRSLIQANFSPDLLSVLPTCQCGAIKGEFAIGELCEQCNTLVKPSINESIEPLIWFRAPIGVSKLINPIVYIMLKRRFNKGGFNVIQWLCDTSFRTQVKAPKVLDHILDAGISRGYNNFIDNFDEIYQTLNGLKEYNKSKNTATIDYLPMLVAEYRDCFFSDYLPLPNRSLLVIEKTYVGIYIDQNIIKAIDAINTVVGIDDPSKMLSQRTKENKTIRTINKLAEYYEQYTRENIAGKPGIFRKHVFGSRTHFSFRAVISSITKIHNYDEIYIPWGIGISALRVHLMNKLLKMGYEHNQAIGYLNAHIEKYSPLLDKLFKELIAETPDGKGIPCLGQRNN